MSGTAIITIEGVLARPTENFITGIPIPTGLMLWHALASQFRIAVVSDVASQDHLEHWLRSHGLRQASYTFCGPLPPLEDDDLVKRRERHITMARSLGASVDLVVDSSPAVVAMAMHMGSVGLLFGHPAYARPEFRPDAPRTIRQWDQIEAATDAARKAHAEWDDPGGVVDNTAGT